MSITIVTTCGTSLFTSACWDLSKVQSRVGLRNRRQEKSINEAINRDIVGESMREDPSGRVLSEKFKKEFWEPVGEHMEDFPAELASLRVLKEFLLKRSNPTVLGRGDSIILVHSTNTEGHFCAEVIRQVLIGHALFPDVGVYPLPVNNLDPLHPEDFGAALVDIWKTLYKEVSRRFESNDELVFNLTGGYKAVVMTVASLCAVSGVDKVWITYLHETAPVDSIFIMRFMPHSSIESKLQIGYVGPTTEYGGGFKAPDG